MLLYIKIYKLWASLFQRSRFFMFFPIINRWGSIVSLVPRVALDRAMLRAWHSHLYIYIKVDFAYLLLYNQSENCVRESTLWLSG